MARISVFARYDTGKKSKGNKYHANKTTVDGVTYDSQKEAYRAQELKLLERAGEIKNLRCQVPYELIPKQRRKDGKAVRNMVYVADFVYEDAKTGETIVEDVKGFKTEKYKDKWKLMLWIHGIEVQEV